MMGEQRLTGEGYKGASEIDFFIGHPATAKERDWKAVERMAGGGDSAR